MHIVEDLIYYIVSYGFCEFLESILIQIGFCKKLGDQGLEMDATKGF